MDQPIFIDNVQGMEVATLREIVEALRETYCGSVGVEFMHIQDPDQALDPGTYRDRGAQSHGFHRSGKRAILDA